MNRIGIVIQRCHESLVGGAESLAWQWANLLKNDYQVEVLTTTAVDAATWDNVLPPGVEERERITIRRFPVDQTRTPYWHELHKLLLKQMERLRLNPMGRSLAWSLALQEEFIYKQGPYSQGLIDFLSGSFQDYKSLIFFTYLFPTTYYGMRQVPKGQCLLVPTLHDEAPAYLSAYRLMAQKALTVLWNTEAEERLGTHLWGELPGHVVGMGISTREFPPYRPGYPYVLYCGRIDPFKGLPQLLEYFMRYKKDYPSRLRLVLTGKDELGLPEHPDIEFRGFVSEEDKFQLMAGALLFVMPSPHESLSIVTLEAMAQRTPVLVNAISEVLTDHIKKSNAGFIYYDYDGFASSLNKSLKEPSDRLRFVDKARDYVICNYSLNDIKMRLMEIIEQS
jgi:glycosyltransferase involved in cell wall biosynthesis